MTRILRDIKIMIYYLIVVSMKIVIQFLQGIVYITWLQQRVLARAKTFIRAGSVFDSSNVTTSVPCSATTATDVNLDF